MGSAPRGRRSPRTLWAARGRRRSCAAGANAPMPGTGRRGVVVGERAARRPFATARADYAFSLSDVAVAGGPSRRSNDFMRAVGEDELAQSARRNYSREALAPSSLPALGSSQPADRTGPPRPASVRYAHHRGTRLAGKGLTPALAPASTSLRDPLRCFATAARLYADASCVAAMPAWRQAGQRSASTARRRPRYAGRESWRRVSLATPAAGAAPNEAAADGAAWRRHPRSSDDARACASGLSRGAQRQHTPTAAGERPDSSASLPLHFIPLRTRARPR